MILSRSVIRFIFVERRMRRHSRRKQDDVLVVGAGSGGQMVVRELRLNPELGNPIGFVDDDDRKRGMRLLGLKVLGGTDQLGEILDRRKPDEVVIAIPSAPGALRGKVVSACREREHPRPHPADRLRAASRRRPAHPAAARGPGRGRARPRARSSWSSTRVGAYLRDQIVLVTGAGGSIGSELSRQIARVRPRLLVLVDHAEDNLFRIDRELVGEWHFSGVESVLADCKEGERMLEVMQRFKPDVVFHAAAYKHVPLMEANPLEAVRNNALATRVTAETAAVAGAERFVLISTDKAVRPADGDGRVEGDGRGRRRRRRDPLPGHGFVSVRFGNVLGSSGSVVPIFRSPDRARRPGHGHPPGHDPLLHDDPRGGPAGDPRRRPRAATATSSCSRWASR